MPRIKGPWPDILLVGDEPYYARVGFARLPPGRVRFPGPVDQNRILGLSLKSGGLLNLSGQMRRPILTIRFAPMARAWPDQRPSSRQASSSEPTISSSATQGGSNGCCVSDVTR